MTGAAQPAVRVVAAALYDRSGRVLISERPAGKHMAGRWEFPGGKLDPGETESGALARELREELGIHVTSCQLHMRLAHRYEDREVALSLWIVSRYEGEPAALEGQRLKWVDPSRLAAEDILEADRAFVEALAGLAPPVAGIPDGAAG